MTPHSGFCFLQYGLDRILGEEKCLALLARAIDPTQPAMMTDVVKLLSAICIVGEDNMYVELSFIFILYVYLSLMSKGFLQSLRQFDYYL